MFNLLYNQASPGSSTSIVDRGFAFITPNTEVLVFILFGVTTTIWEAVGYWKYNTPETLFQGGVLDSDLKVFIMEVSNIVRLIRKYSLHVYLASYLLLPYPVLMEKQRMLLVPWLICGAIRSLLLNLISSLAGIVICSTYGRVNYPCVRFSMQSAIELCIAHYVWTSVHNFYYSLERVAGFKAVLRTIHLAGRRSRTVCDTASPTSLFSMEQDEDSQSSTSEATLVERAAMAWIAREILESGGVYVNDAQFSNYLTVKATMELKQIVKEIIELKRVEKEQQRVRTSNEIKAERIKTSLEYFKLGYGVSSSTLVAKGSSYEGMENFGHFSKRDPIRKIAPLVIDGKPNPRHSAMSGQSRDSEKSEDSQQAVRALQESVFNLSNQSHSGTRPKMTTRSFSSQTNPLTPIEVRFFDKIEANMKKENKDEYLSNFSYEN